MNMYMVKYKCPYTKEVISDKNQIGAYVRHTVKKYNITSDELRYLIFVESYGDLVKFEKFKYYYIDLKYSLLMFKSEFELEYRTTQFLIGYHKLPSRTHKEATKVGAVRAKITNIARYGVDQIFKVKEFDDKKNKTDKNIKELIYDKISNLEN